MAKTKKKEANEGLDLIENPDALVSKTEEFFNQKKNQNIVFGVGGVLALIVVAFMSYNYYISSRNQEAQEEMFQAVYYFEADSVYKALNGDGNAYGFLDITDFYSGTKAANLANFYIGASYMKLGEYENAIRALDDFSSNDVLVQARAYALIGDANMELDDFESAISAYNKAVGHKPNKDYTPGYLVKLAIAHEANGDLASAASAYGKILEDYFGATEYQDAKKQKARLEGLLVE